MRLFVVFVECLVVKKNWEKDFNFVGDSAQGTPSPVSPLAYGIRGVNGGLRPT